MTKDRSRLLLSWPVQQRIFAASLITPVLILLILTVGVPIVAGVVTSLQRVRLNLPTLNSNFVGLENYERMLGSQDFWHSMSVSAVYTVGSVALTFVLGLGTALLFSRATKWSAIARTVTLLPWATPVVAGSLVWGVMYDYDSGILNRIIHLLPGNLHNVPWLIDPRVALWSVILVDAWHTFPLAMVLLLAGIQGIPRELYEAAAVDGASVLQRFRFVTLPCLAPISNVTLLLLAVWAFRRFDIVYLLTRGGPGDATATLTMNTFDRAFRYYDLSYSATLGVATMIISAFMAAIYLRSLRRQAMN